MNIMHYEVCLEKIHIYIPLPINCPAFLHFVCTWPLHPPLIYSHSFQYQQGSFLGIFHSIAHHAHLHIHNLFIHAGKIPTPNARNMIMSRSEKYATESNVYVHVLSTACWNAAWPEIVLSVGLNFGCLCCCQYTL